MKRSCVRLPWLLAALLVLFLSGAAVAATAPATDVGWGGLLGTFLEGITPLLLDLLLAGGVLLVGLAGQWVHRVAGSVKNDTFRNALLTVDRLAEAKVLELYQSAIEDLKAASADGRLTLEEAQAAGATALAEITDSLPRWLISTLTTSVQGSLAEVQEKYLMPAIEQAVTGSHVLTAARSVVDPNADSAKLQERMLAARARIGLAD